MLVYYFMMADFPMMFMLVNFRSIYLHHIDFRYSTFDLNYDKNTSAADQRYTDVRKLPKEIYENVLNGEERKNCGKGTVVFRAAYSKTKIGPYTAILPILPQEFEDREERKKNYSSINLHQTNAPFNINSSK